MGGDGSKGNVRQYPRVQTHSQLPIRKVFTSLPTPFLPCPSRPSTLSPLSYSHIISEETCISSACCELCHARSRSIPSKSPTQNGFQYDSSLFPLPFPLFLICFVRPYSFPRRFPRFPRFPQRSRHSSVMLPLPSLSFLLTPLFLLFIFPPSFPPSLPPSLPLSLLLPQLSDFVALKTFSTQQAAARLAWEYIKTAYQGWKVKTPLFHPLSLPPLSPSLPLFFSPGLSFLFSWKEEGRGGEGMMTDGLFCSHFLSQNTFQTKEII